MYIWQFFTLIPFLESFLESDLKYLAGMFRFQARFEKMKTSLRQPAFRGVSGDVRSLLALLMTIYVHFGYKTRLQNSILLQSCTTGVNFCTSFIPGIGIELSC